jgi:transcriptional regulator of arginine metabolism
MNKSFRQGQILNIIRSQQIYTQDELARELVQHGIQTTQVTLSRDIREMGLVKTSDGYRRLNTEPRGAALADVIDEYMQDVKVAQNMVVIRTSPGNANTLAVALDNEELAEIVGTLAGDDTILVVAPDNTAAVQLRQKLMDLIMHQ